MIETESIRNQSWRTTFSPVRQTTTATKSDDNNNKTRLRNESKEDEWREREKNKKKVRSPTSIEKVDSVELDCNWRPVRCGGLFSLYQLVKRELEISDNNNNNYTTRRRPKEKVEKRTTLDWMEIDRYIRRHTHTHTPKNRFLYNKM